MKISLSDGHTAANALLFILFNILMLPLWSQEEYNHLMTIPPSEGPLEVRFGYAVLDITNINGKEETIDFEGAIFMKWKDERLAYQPADSLSNENFPYKVPERLYQGALRINQAYKGWFPVLYFPNGVGNRTITNQNIAVWPDGTVQYSEGFMVKAETPMEMRPFPFDSQSLSLYIHPTPYTNRELVFVPDMSLSKNWEHGRGLTEWELEGDNVIERTLEIRVRDGGTIPISEIMISLKVRRLPGHIIFRTILPMILLVSLTWIVFWLDIKSTMDRISILFIGILSVVAYDFVIQDYIPKIPYLTLIDVFVIENFLILVFSVIVTLITGWFFHNGKPDIGKKLNRISRWAFPASYVAIAIIIYVVYT
ncbi:MAG: hypothetical protein R3356_03020 [Eudoraea sp.]|nr:hypothetical protein [Eudoraea sp.]